MAALDLNLLFTLKVLLQEGSVVGDALIEIGMGYPVIEGQHRAHGVGAELKEIQTSFGAANVSHFGWSMSVAIGSAQIEIGAGGKVCVPEHAARIEVFEVEVDGHERRRHPCGVQVREVADMAPGDVFRAGVRAHPRAVGCVAFVQSTCVAILDG